MSKKPDLRTPAPGVAAEKAGVILEELERILGSPQFRGSRRCQSLLRYVVEHTVAGDTAQLKERTLGIEVFERPPDYDTSQDPVVRATAGEIRKKLAQYYQEPGHGSEYRIELLPGSYIAEFHPANNTAQNRRPRRSLDRRLWLRIGLGGAVVAAAAAVLWLTMLSPKARETDLQQLWRPVLKAPGTVLISLGQPIVYNLKSAAAQDEIQGIGTEQPGTGPQPDSILKKDLVILPDRYAAMGDVICLVRLTSMLEKYGKPYRIRGERSTTFADLRETPAVLIGAYDNQWTLHAVGQLRFTFEKDAVHETDFVRDRQHPERVEWKLTGAWPYWQVTTDYAIVSRIIDTSTDRPVVIAAGITQYGTTGAGEFLTNPDYFAEAAAKLPKGWSRKNVQFVLRVPVINRVGGHPQVLAVQVW
jgi:hypothetical protein